MWVLLVLIFLVILVLFAFLYRSPNLATENKVSIPFATKTHLKYDANLPYQGKERVYLVDVVIKLVDFRLQDEGAITQDIHEAGEFTVEKFFTYDTTWNPRLLPLQNDVILETGTQILMKSDESTDHDILIDIIPEPDAYLVGNIEIMVIGIYPRSQMFNSLEITKI